MPTSVSIPASTLRSRGLLGAGVAAAIAVAGCGGSGARQMASGKTVFRSECGMCHSLSGHRSRRQEGEDLSRRRMRRGILLRFAAEMPVPHPLTRASLNAVVKYILAVERRDRV